MTNGRAPSCISTRSQEGPAASRPRRTESCLLSPPGITFLTLWIAWAWTISTQTRSTAAPGTTTTISFIQTERWKGVKVRARRGIPAKRTNCLPSGLPNLRPSPAAGIKAKVRGVMDPYRCRQGGTVVHISKRRWISCSTTVVSVFRATDISFMRRLRAMSSIFRSPNERFLSYLSKTKSRRTSAIS